MTDGRTSPLHPQHVAAGASFTDFAGWQMPVRYSSDLAEHHAVRTAAGLFDLSHMGEILVAGPEAAAALDFALAGRLSAIAEGQAKYSLLLDEAGGILDDLVVYRTGADRFLVVANASNRDLVAAELARRADGFDCGVHDESDDIALIAIQGPRSLEILNEVEGLHVDDLASLRYYRIRSGLFGEHALLVARTGYTGEDGFELYLAPDAAPALWESLLEVGGVRGLVPAGLASRDTLRLEAGMPLYGHELSVETGPAQVGLGRVVNFAKEGDFVGRAALEGAASEHAPVLVGLRADGRRAGRAGYAVYGPSTASGPSTSSGTGADPIGVVTSGALSPTLGYPIAMALVHPSLATVGEQLYLDVRGSRVAASVVSLPFYKREA